jgi:hypothetical protein
MIAPSSLVRRLLAGQKLVWIFSGTVLLPGLMLAIFGLRSIVQERGRMEEEMREDLKAAAELIGVRLGNDLAASGSLIRLAGEDAKMWPAPFRAAAGEAGSLAVLVRRGRQMSVTPARQVLCDCGLAEGSSLPAGGRAAELHQEARELKKAGRTRDALRLYKRIEKEPPVLLGSLPTDLVAAYESLMMEPGDTSCAECPSGAVRLYQRLVEGHWQLEKASYAFYSGRLRAMLPSGPQVNHWREVERRKLSLTAAVESYLENPRPYLHFDDGYYIALSRGETQGTVIVGERFLRSHIWPAAFQNLTGKTGFALLEPDGKLLFGRMPGPQDGPVILTPLPGEPQMLLQSWPIRPAAALASREWQLTLYAATLSLAALLLLSGAYLSVRAIKAELRMAQLKEDFVSTVSHEFRSPLAGLNQLGEMLRDDRVPDEKRRRDYYQLIVAETQRLRRLVENVLDFSQIQEGRKSYHMEMFSPTPWLREIAAETESAWSGSGLRVVAAIEEELPVLTGDREALSTAMRNLMDNAMKYSGASKVVELTARANASELTISVRDYGTGFAERKGRSSKPAAVCRLAKFLRRRHFLRWTLRDIV